FFGLPTFFISVIRLLLTTPYFRITNMSRTKQKPMANNLPTEKKVLAISLLAEGNSIRSIERTTGVHRDTVMRLGVRVGDACRRIHNERMQNIGSKQIEIDEIWGFIGKKRKNTQPWDFQQGIGDVWTFVALDPDTKLIPAFHVAQRTEIHCEVFLKDLESRLI